MKILWFTWKDLSHPLAGGAEVVNEGIAKRLISEGHEVLFIVSGYAGSTYEEEHKDGYKIIRLGNRYTIYWKAYRYYRKNLSGWADLVIEEVNTIPFLTKLYVTERKVLLMYQLCRQVWFYQMPFPISHFGYMVEPLYLRYLNDQVVLTESMSTKRDLVKYGFSENGIKLFDLATGLEATRKIPRMDKYKNKTILSFGSIRPMKRTTDILSCFESARSVLPHLKLIICGDADSKYGQKFINRINKSEFKEDIIFLGKVNSEKKVEIMSKCHLLISTSVKEGWGLTVTEAAMLGTPSVVYDVDGLRDSTHYGRAGIIVEENNISEMRDAISSILNNDAAYRKLRREAWEMSRFNTWERSYTSFKEGLII